MTEQDRLLKQQAQTAFDAWWGTDGRFIDPDTGDVSWFDKRKGLAAYAFEAGSALREHLMAAAPEAQFIDYIREHHLRAKASMPSPRDKAAFHQWCDANCVTFMTAVGMLLPPSPPIPDTGKDGK